MHNEPTIQKFVFASESCIPIVPLYTALQSIYSHHITATSDVDLNIDPTLAIHTSWIMSTNIPNNGYAKQLQFDVIGQRIPSQYIYKASQWLLLSRYHANHLFDLLHYLHSPSTTLPTTSMTSSTPSIIDNKAMKEVILKNPLFTLFQGTSASDEMFFPTCLAMLDYLSTQSTQDQVEEDKVKETKVSVLQRVFTFADWTNNGRNPKTFLPFHCQDIAAALQSTKNQCLFFRKMQFGRFVEARKKKDVQQQDVELLSKWWHCVYNNNEEAKGSTVNTSISTIEQAYEPGVVGKDDSRRAWELVEEFARKKYFNHDASSSTSSSCPSSLYDNHDNQYRDDNTQRSEWKGRDWNEAHSFPAHNNERERNYNQHQRRKRSRSRDRSESRNRYQPTRNQGRSRSHSRTRGSR